MTLEELKKALLLLSKENKFLNGKIKNFFRDMPAAMADEVEKIACVIGEISSELKENSEDKKRNALVKQIKKYCQLVVSTAQVREHFENEAVFNDKLQGLLDLGHAGATWLPGNLYFMENNQTHSLRVAIQALLNGRDTDGLELAFSKRREQLMTYLTKAKELYESNLRQSGISDVSKREAENFLEKISEIQKRFFMVEMAVQDEKKAYFRKAIDQLLNLLPDNSALTSINNSLTQANFSASPQNLRTVQDSLLAACDKSFHSFSFFKEESLNNLQPSKMTKILRGFYSYLSQQNSLENWGGYTDLAIHIRRDLKQNFKKNYSQDPLISHFRKNVDRVSRINRSLKEITDSDAMSRQKVAAVFKIMIDSYNQVITTGEPESLKGGYLAQLQSTLSRYEGAMDELTKVRYIALMVKKAVKLYRHEADPGKTKETWANEIANHMDSFINCFESADPAVQMQALLKVLMDQEKDLVLYDRKTKILGLRVGGHKLHDTLVQALKQAKPLLSKTDRGLLEFSLKTSQLAAKYGKETSTKRPGEEDKGRRILPIIK